MLSDREKMDEWRKQQIDLMGICVRDARKVLADMPDADELGLLYKGAMNGFIPRIACEFFVYRLDAIMNIEEEEVRYEEAKKYHEEVLEKIAAEKTG